MAYQRTGKIKLLQGWKVVADADEAGDASAPPTETPPADVYDDDIPF